jgi:1,5-anhydro-D-fructose reductase (1,5-anhydro-D-mannitol-forming)
MPDALRIAVLGFWHVHAADYAREAQEHPDTRVVAVWDDDESLGRPGADRFGVPYLASLDELLARDDVDAVTVTTETARHHEVMTKAAAAGKHIFTEKVLAPTVAEAEAIVAATDAHDVRLVVSLPRLAHGYTRAITDILAAGSLGRLTHARVRLSHDGAVPRDGGPGWLPERFFDPSAAIGGALTDLGCHPVYLVQRFLGFDVESVAATYRSVFDHAVEDHAVVTVTYAGGAIGVIEAGFVNRAPFAIEVGGTDGTVRFTDDRRVMVATGRAFGAPGSHYRNVPPDVPGPFAQWVEHIRAGTRADDNVERAVELTRLVAASNRAASEGRAIPYRA